MTTLQKELINLLVKLKDQAASSERKALERDIDTLKKNAHISETDAGKVGVYIMKIFGRHPSLFDNEKTKVLLDEFQVNIGLINKPHKTPAKGKGK